MVLMYLLIASASWCVGSEGICLYIVVSERWSSLSCMYVCLSSITMHEPLLAFLITMDVSDASSRRAANSDLLRLGR